MLQWVDVELMEKSSNVTLYGMMSENRSTDIMSCAEKNTRKQ